MRWLGRRRVKTRDVRMFSGSEIHCDNIISITLPSLAELSFLGGETGLMLTSIERS